LREIVVLVDVLLVITEEEDEPKGEPEFGHVVLWELEVSLSPVACPLSLSACEEEVTSDR
jgi:hypothetical protein